jgi:hypothetical protein
MQNKRKEKDLQKFSVNYYIYFYLCDYIYNMSQTLTFTLIGGKGGVGSGNAVFGGGGTKTIATLTINNGTELFLAVGGNGVDAGGVDADGGYNGGGNGDGAGGGGGGGATHVALRTGTLVQIGEANKSEVLIVAAGGGAGGMETGGNGGVGSGGGNGGLNTGGGGTSSSGGVGRNGNNGGFGFGGNDVAGGGSGYYGGGGHYGGGGGSSFITSIGSYNANANYSNVGDAPSITIADSDGNTLFTSSTSGQILTFTVPTPPPVASACFLKDTVIKTDSGNVKIQDIKEEKHTINGKKVKALTKTLYAKKGDSIPPFLVSIPKGALFKNSPDRETFVSPLHSVFYHGQLIYAKDLVLMDKASPVNYNYKDHVYDILLDTHEKMVANNMIVETLDPESITGRFYRHFVINKKASSEEKALAKTILYEFNNFYWNECLNYPKINPEMKYDFDEAVYKKFLLTCKTSEKKKIFKSLV